MQTTYSNKKLIFKMKQVILNILIQNNLDSKVYNIDKLYKAGIDNIINNIEYYYDKPYTCNSVLKELFERGVINELKESQYN